MTARLPSRARPALAALAAAAVGYLVAGGWAAIVTGGITAAILLQAELRAPQTDGATAVPAWYMRVAPIAVVLLLVAVCVTLAMQVRGTRAPAARPAAAAAPAAAAVAPGGFAESCVRLWLRAGAELTTRMFLDTCQPGVDERTLEAQTPSRIQVAQVAALGPPLTRQERPGYWSVLVAAHLDTPIVGREGRVRGWRPVEPVYYRAAVHVSARGLALRGLPKQVAAPVDPQAPSAAGRPTAPQPDDPRAAVIREYLQRYLPAPPAADPAAGDVANYLVPGPEPVTAHSRAVESVELEAVAFTEDPADDRLVRALAEVLVTYQGGGRLVQHVPFSLTRQGSSQWLVSDTPPVPPLEESP